MNGMEHSIRIRLPLLSSSIIEVNKGALLWIPIHRYMYILQCEGVDDIAIQLVEAKPFIFFCICFDSIPSIPFLLKNKVREQILIINIRLDNLFVFFFFQEKIFFQFIFCSF